MFWAIPLAAGAALGIGKHINEKAGADADRALTAEQIRYSPWTGRQQFQEIRRPSLFGNLASGIGAGALVGQAAGAFSNPVSKWDLLRRQGVAGSGVEDLNPALF